MTRTKAWGQVQPQVAQQTRARAYDRAGLGFSDGTDDPGTSENAVRDLRRLLQAAAMHGPFVLVGHSYGGMNVRLFAARHPAEVAGLVLVDPSHEDLGRDIGALDPETTAGTGMYVEELGECLQAEPREFVAGSRLFALCVAGADPRYSDKINAVEIERGIQPARMRAWISEMTHVWAASADQVRRSPRTLGRHSDRGTHQGAVPTSGAETPELRAAKNAVWLRLHEEIAAMSSRGRRLTVENSGHNIQLDRPDVVVSAILEVVYASRCVRSSSRRAASSRASTPGIARSSRIPRARRPARNRGRRRARRALYPPPHAVRRRR
ncbi:MAG: alpha/beta hydrolase [Desulfobacterales bacterium]|nr:alpha/beta hydrolase [Desulfobacterales bacterium]